MDDFVTLSFHNRDADPEFTGIEQNTEMKVERSAVVHITRWYGGYCAGDDYDIKINGETVEKDINGEINFK